MEDTPPERGPKRLVPPRVLLDQLQQEVDEFLWLEARALAHLRRLRSQRRQRQRGLQALRRQGGRGDVHRLAGRPRKSHPNSRPGEQREGLSSN